MDTFLIQTENAEEVKLIQSFLEKHKLKGRILSDEDKEDIVLGRLMEETEHEDVIDTNSFLKKLRS